MKKYFFLIFAILLIVPLVNAAPPFESQNVLGMQFAPSSFEQIAEGEDFKAHIHVINATAIQTNETTSCLVHIYSSNGGHLIEANMGFDNNGLEFDYTIAGGNQTLGMYSYIVYCNNTNNENHIVKGSYEVTYSGKVLSSSQATIYLGLLGILVFSLFATFFGMSFLPKGNVKDEEGRIMSINHLKHFRLVLWLFAYFLFVAIMFLSSNIAFAFLSEQLFAKTLFAIFGILMAISPVIVIVLVISFFVKFFHDKQFQRLLNRGIFPGNQL